MTRRHSHNRQVLERILEQFPEDVFETIIAKTIRFPETTVVGEPITTYATSSRWRSFIPPSCPRTNRQRRRTMTRRATLPGADELIPFNTHQH
jgi:cellulose biosynthesis protein BcsQ